MRRTGIHAACLLLASGCLGDLVKPPAIDGGGGDGDGGGSEPDAGPTVDFPGDLAIRHTPAVVDLNANGWPDLVLLNDPPNAADRGVLVFYDRPSGFFAAPDQFLPTAPLHPLVSAAGDFVGGAPLDLVVLANNADDDPYLVLFENGGDSSLEQVAMQGFADREMSAMTVDDPWPIFATPIQIRDDGPLGLVFGDSDLALAVSPDDWTALTAASEFSVDAETTTMNTSIPIPSAEAGRNDLFVLDNQGGIWLENNGSAGGGFQAGPTPFPGWENFNRSFFLFDYQPDGILDFITLDRSFLDVGLVGWDAGVSMEVSRLDPELSFGDSFGDSMFATDIDGMPGIDFLILDDIKPGAQDDELFGVHAARNVAVVGNSATPDSGRIDVDASHLGDPTMLVAGDFDRDDDVEVWVFDSSLTTKMCLIGEIYDLDRYRFDECE